MEEQGSLELAQGGTHFGFVGTACSEGQHRNPERILGEDVPFVQDVLVLCDTEGDLYLS